MKRRGGYDIDDETKGSLPFRLSMALSCSIPSAVKMVLMPTRILHCVDPSGGTESIPVEVLRVYQKCTGMCMEQLISNIVTQLAL